MVASRWLKLLALIVPVVLALNACSNPTVVPTSVSLAVAITPTASLPTNTPVPPTDTPTTVPPTSTPVPPTATSVPATRTSVPPTFTSLPVTATSVQPAATRVPPTATKKPATAAPTAAPASAVSVEWLSGMGYEGRDGSSRWCQMQMVYHNNGTTDLTWPAYQPVFVIMDAAGNVTHRYRAGFYGKKYGWPNGIEGDPPTIPAGQSSFVWTWYSVAMNDNGELCRYVYVVLNNRLIAAAEYDTQGNLVNKNATLPR